MLAVAPPPPRVALVPNAIAFRDPRHGLMGTGWQACAENSAFGCKAQGTISTTDDGGRTWTVLLRTPRPVVAVSVAGAHERATFDDGETIGSSDRGLHWRPVAVGTSGFASQCPTGLQSWVSGSWVLCTGEGGTGNQSKSVYRFTPHGLKRVAYTPFGGGRGYGGISAYGYPQGIAMATNGFGVIWEWRGTLYVTRDGGRQWSGLPKVARPEVDFGMSGFALRDGVGFVVLAAGGSEARRLIETTDAGRSWRVVHVWR